MIQHQHTNWMKGQLLHREKILARIPKRKNKCQLSFKCKIGVTAKFSNHRLLPFVKFGFKKTHSFFFSFIERFEQNSFLVVSFSITLSVPCTFQK